jgi:hypothetical protein
MEFIKVRIVSGITNFSGDIRFSTRERAEQFIRDCAEVGIVVEFI